MKLRDVLIKAKNEHMCTCDDLLNCEIDVRINDNGKWIEFDIDGFKEVVNIEESK